MPSQPKWLLTRKRRGAPTNATALCERKAKRNNNALRDRRCDCMHQLPWSCNCHVSHVPTSGVPWQRSARRGEQPNVVCKSWNGPSVTAKETALPTITVANMGVGYLPNVSRSHTFSVRTHSVRTHGTGRIKNKRAEGCTLLGISCVENRVLQARRYLPVADACVCASHRSAWARGHRWRSCAPKHSVLLAGHT